MPVHTVAKSSIPFALASFTPVIAFFVYLLIGTGLDGNFEQLANQIWQEKHLVRDLIAIGGAVWVVSTAHLLVFGIPAVYLLQKFNRMRWWTLGPAGFVTGALPFGIWRFPHDLPYQASSSYMNGQEMITTMVDGVTTLAGWVQYLKGVALLGALGGIAALSLWLTWKWLHSPPSRAAVRAGGAPAA